MRIMGPARVVQSQLSRCERVALLHVQMSIMGPAWVVQSQLNRCERVALLHFQVKSEGHRSSIQFLLIQIISKIYKLFCVQP